MQKATHETIELFQPVVKSSEGKYIAVLSDDSIDRDGEIIGKQALQKIMDDDGYTVALMDHTNKILNQVGEWTNKRLEQIGEHTAFVAEPKFYESNPNAQIIKGMLDEGAKMGISIGAIPSNRHGRAMAVAKSYIKPKEEILMEETEKKVDVEELNKLHTEEVAKLKKDVEEAEAAKEEAEEKVEAAEEKVEEAEAKVEDAEKKYSEVAKELEDLKKQAVRKHIQDTPTVEEAKEQMDKAIEGGAIPVVRK